MSSTVTTKQINSGVLAKQLGVSVIVRGAESSTSQKTVEADVDAATLGSAIAAHVFVDEQANDEALRQAARLALVANRAFLAAAKPGTAAAQASSAYDQTKALTRQMNGVLRLLLGDLTGTD